MKKRDFLKTTVLVLSVAWGFGSEVRAQLEGGIDELTREMGFALELSFEKTVAITGALLHIAREKLLSLEFAKVAKFLSGTERLIFQAANEVNGALPKTIEGLAPILEKLALPPEAGDNGRAFIVQYLREKGGREVVALLQKAWRA
ncbi:MAG: hypothetical protein FJ179_03810 [Gammaproteobacteria bacterium]|nr:hypothetical protein [Gammaproteobacteria bacterium]